MYALDCPRGVSGFSLSVLLLYVCIASLRLSPSISSPVDLSALLYVALWVSRPSLVVSMVSLYYRPLSMFLLYVCHRLYGLPVAISGRHDVALCMP